MEAYSELREWSWWKLYCKVKPLLAVWRAEEELKERDVSYSPQDYNVLLAGSEERVCA